MFCYPLNTNLQHLVDEANGDFFVPAGTTIQQMKDLLGEGSPNWARHLREKTESEYIKVAIEDINSMLLDPDIVDVLAFFRGASQMGLHLTLYVKGTYRTYADLTGASLHGKSNPTFLGWRKWGEWN